MKGGEGKGDERGECGSVCVGGGRSEWVCGAIKPANPGYEPEHTHITNTHFHHSGTVTFLVWVA